MAGKGGLVDADYFDVLVEMMRRYPNLYGDISAFNIPTRSKHFLRCLDLERVVHGSDYPGAGVWALGVDAGAGELGNVSTMGTRAECVGARLSVETRHRLPG